MSADIWIEHLPCTHCGRGEDKGESLNITYNLSGMLHTAGFKGWAWCEGKTAREVGDHMLKVLDFMYLKPSIWREMNPSNGWGTYDGCLQVRMRRWAERAKDAAPQDIVKTAL